MPLGKAEEAITVLHPESACVIHCQDFGVRRMACVGDNRVAMCSRESIKPGKSDSKIRRDTEKVIPICILSLLALAGEGKRTMCLDNPQINAS